ncbi:MAG: Fe-S cluster assembly protein NifU [Myxococcota bacterium]
MAWKYSEKVKEHFKNPRNVGVVTNADAVGEVGSMVCGDALKLSLKIEPETDKILDARFQTYGCGSAIASSSALTEMIKGMTVDEALAVSNQELAEYLDGLPEEKMHCSVMGKDALEDAIKKYRGEETSSHEEEDEGKIVCHCFAVTDKSIEKAIRENNLKTTEEVTHYTKAGGACGSCLGEIEDIIHDVRSRMKQEKPSQSKESQKVSTKTKTGTKSLKKGMTTYKKIKIIEKLFEEEIRPSLGMDHGGLELVEVEEDKVYVHLLGACSGCAQSDETLEYVRSRIEEELGQPIIIEDLA